MTFLIPSMLDYRSDTELVDDAQRTALFDDMVDGLVLLTKNGDAVDLQRFLHKIDDALRLKIGEVDTRVADLEDERDGYSSDLADANTTIDELRDDVEFYRQEVSNLKAELEALRYAKKTSDEVAD